MGESACLLQQQQQPFCYASGIPNEDNESDLIHAFGQSISFGRFGTESLAWEKWSSFSHNRYVEEAERYSRPGSVAEKKAFFEAHYKKLAAQKAAALLEQANRAAPNNGVNQEHDSTVHRTPHYQATSPTSNKEEIKVVIFEPDAIPSSRSCSDSHSDMPDVNGVEECQPLLSDSQNQLDDVHTQKKDTSEEHGGGNYEDQVLAPMSPKKPPASSLKSFNSTETCKSNLTTPDIHISHKKENIMGTPMSSQKPALSLVDEKRSTITFTPICSVDKKISTINSTPISSVDKRSTLNSTPISSVDKKKSTVNYAPISLVDKTRSTVNSTPISSVDKTRSTVNSTPISSVDKTRSTVSSTPISSVDMKRSTVSSTPMSSVDMKRSTVSSTPMSSVDMKRSTINSTPSCSVDKKKSTVTYTPISSVGKKRSTVNFTPIRELNRLTASVMRKFEGARIGNASSKASKDSSTPLRTPTMASKTQLQKPPAVTPLTEKRRTKTPVASLASSSNTAGPKWRLPSTENKMRSPIIASPFSLRTEERAVRRKKKLEEKFNANEAQKVQLHTKIKEKAETEIRRLRQSFCFKARPLLDFYKERKELKNEINKCQCPESPKQGKKPPGRLWAKSSVTAQKSTAKNDGSKNNLETNGRSSNHHLTSSSRMTAPENASPNIQLDSNHKEFTQQLEQGITRKCRRAWHNI